MRSMCGVVLVGALVAPTGADLTYVSQIREVAASSFAPNAGSVADGFDALGLGLFDETAVSFVDDGIDFGSGIASQRSFLGGGGITLSGAVTARSSVDGSGRAFSSLEATFELTQATGVRLDVDLTDLDLGNPWTFLVILEDDAGDRLVDYDQLDLGNVDTGDFSFAPLVGVLDPGRYTFRFRAIADSFEGATVNAGYDVVLLIPGPPVLAVLGASFVACRRRR